jgi:hypothetical protein
VTVTETDRISAAQSYIDALVSHRADGVPFAPDCTRIEFGLKTGFSGNHLRRSLNRGAQHRVIESTTAPRYSTDGDVVRAEYDVISKPSLLGRRVCAHVDETFAFSADGLITQIHASVRPFIHPS